MFINIIILYYSFSNEVSQFLTGKNIPEFITNLPREALNT